jgi:hypothetical protein
MKKLEKVIKKLNLLPYLVILTLLSSGHINFNSIFDDFRKLIFVIILLLIFVHITFINKIEIPISKDLFLIPFSLCLIYALFYLLRFNLYNFIGWVFSSCMVLLIWNLSSKQILFLLKKYLIVISTLIFFGLVIVILVDYETNNYNYSGEYRSYILKIFANSDSWFYTDVNGKKFFRFSFFLQQSSLVATYIILPFCIYSLLEKTHFNILIILTIALIFSVSSTVLVIVMLGLIIYYFFDFFKHNIKIIYLLSFIFSITVGLIFYILYDMQSNYDFINYFFLRISSGAYRLEYIGNQTYHFFTKYFFGYFDNQSDINTYLLGNFHISSGIKGGFICLILSIVFFIRISIAIFLVKNANKFACAILMSCILVLTNIQDFGISSISGFIFFSLLARLLDQTLQKK